MKNLLLLFALVLGIEPTYADYEFEKSLFEAGSTCDELVGVWYTSVVIGESGNAQEHHYTRIERKEDGRAFLKGLSIVASELDVNDWEFFSEWRCADDWYVEKNRWGYTAFKIIKVGEENVMKDELGNFNSSRINLVETKTLKTERETVKQYFESN